MSPAYIWFNWWEINKWWRMFASVGSVNKYIYHIRLGDYQSINPIAQYGLV